MTGRRLNARGETLTQSLARLLSKELLPDLRARAKEPSVVGALRRRWEHEKAERRTGEDLAGWVEQTLEQVGAAWILSCVFVRMLEDRGLVDQRRLAGPGAEDSLQMFYEIAPELGVRDYLLTVFRDVSRLPGAEELLGPARNPAWRLSPSEEAVRKILEEFQRPGAEGQGLRWNFEGTSTRFLGDLYQDLSESVRDRYALLQTPDFVEEFILDLALEPAVAEFGVTSVKLIDPTCGSGHFLLGAYDRLYAKRQAAEPGKEPREHALAALAQVFGVDINPYAVAIAKFRLMLALLEKAGIRKLSQAPRLPLNMVVADSLLHGKGNEQRRLSEGVESKEDWGDELFTLEDEAEARRLLGQEYEVVVGNPPFITCRDAALRDLYRERYTACYREYALGAPFTERFFQLARMGGFVGLINANSFMKREFGKKLVEEVLPKLDLTDVIDTSGAYIPGHTTPTVILAGRNQKPIKGKVSAVLGRSGEPGTPAEPAKGKVWLSIVEHLREMGYEDEFVTIGEMPRSTLAKHPWSLGGGGAADLKDLLEARSKKRLREVVAEIGFGAVTREDDVYLIGSGPLLRARVPRSQARPLVVGESVRDWGVYGDDTAIWPYDAATLEAVQPPESQPVERFLWPWKRQLSQRVAYGKSQLERGLKWYEYSMFFRNRFRTPLTIAFAFVATHNHFVLDRGGKVFNRSAPIIKLPEGANEDEHLALLGYLNSSTACFWMKQVFHPKYGANKKDHPDPARFFYEFTGTGLGALPVPSQNTELAPLARELVDLASRRANLLSLEYLRAAVSRASVVEDVANSLRQRWREWDRVRERMILLQEEIDWRVYEAVGLTERLALPGKLVEGTSLARGDRPFERLAGRVSLVRREGRLLSPLEAEAPPLTELDPRFAEIWARREESIRSSRELRLIERPAFKRLWRDTESNITEQEFRDATDREQLIALVLEHVEAAIAKEGRPTSTAAVAVEMEGDFRRRRIAEALGASDVSLRELVHESTAGEAVPFIASMRFTETGLEKRKAWERAWDLQRREDANGAGGDEEIPPRFEPNDYRVPEFWRLRGKLDVAHERFISYPGAEREGEGMLIGWAGWDHLQRSQALAYVYNERRHQDGWPKEKLTPLLAGLWELVPWLKQWHNEPSADHGGERLGEYFERYVQSEARSLGLTVDDLRAWRPATRAKGRRKERAGNSESTE